jgi:hypothetical protein
MSMMDFASALGGAPGGGPPPGGGADTGGPPPDDTSGGSDQYTTSTDALRGALDAMHAYIQLEPDAVDKATGGSILQAILKLQAKDQTDTQQGNLPALKRALLASGAGSPAGSAVGY